MSIMTCIFFAIQNWSFVIKKNILLLLNNIKLLLTIAIIIHKLLNKMD